MSQYVVCALYRFVTLDNFATLREPLHQLMLDQGVRGTLLLAQEGINGTIAGTRQGIDRVLEWLRCDPRLEALDSKESFDDTLPFYRTRVKLKKEIVTLGVKGIDPTRSVGTYIEPEKWNELISDPDVLLIDTRNQYEVGIGTFHRAINPQTDKFRDFPAYVKKNLDPEKHKKVAMFCTGGIRCEKSTAYLKSQGFDEVYHLQGGILNYLERVPQQESLWQGECFVFDNRVSVNHSLEKGAYDLCHACRLPITDQDKMHSDFEEGVSCPHCFEQTDPAQKQRFRERQRQMVLARKRGEQHIGTEVTDIAVSHREQKLRFREAQRQQNSKK